MKKTHVYAAFPGCGKSTFTRMHPELTVSDSDSSHFDKEHFPTNYIHHIKKLIGEGNHDVIFISSHDTVRKALDQHNIKFTLVYPSEECKEEYVQRYIQRGSSEFFIQLLKENFEKWVDECRNDPCPNKIELKPGHYMADVVQVIN